MKYIYLQHIPKTGGTSVRHFFLKKQRQRIPVRFVWSSDWRKAHEPFKTKAQICRLTKHNVTPENLFMCVFLRDPIEHSRSLYSWIKKYRPHPYHKYANKVDFTTWLKEYEPLKDYYCNYLAPNARTAEKALKNLKHFDYVGSLETINQDMNRILNMMGFRFKYDGTHYAGTRTVKFEVTKSHIEIIKARRPEDFKLMESLK
jgi:hypothetical protein